MVVMSVAACALRFGFNPLVSLFTAIALAASVLTRNRVPGVVAPIILSFLMQLVAFLSGATVVRHFLLTSKFEAFHGFFHDPTYGAMVTRAIWLSVLCAVPPLALAYRAFSRRDVAGG